MLIHNEQQYNKYLEEFNRLVAQDPDLNTAEGERLSLLAMVIKEYEDNPIFYLEVLRCKIIESGPDLET